MDSEGEPLFGVAMVMASRLLTFHAPGGGIGPSLGHRNLDRRSVRYGVKSILSARAKIVDSVIALGTDDVDAIAYVVGYFFVVVGLIRLT